MPRAEPPGRCVLLTHEFAPFRGGVATYVQEMAWAAERAGWPVEVWTVDYRRRDVPGRERSVLSDSRLPFPVVRFASNGRLTPGGLLTLAWGICRRRLALRGRRVILLSVGAQMAFFLLGAPGVVSAERVTCFFHGSEMLRFRRNPFWRWLARRFYARAAGFAVNSFHVEHLLRDSGLLPEGAAIAVAPCACPSVFRNEGVNTETAADDGVWRVLTVARLHPRKGQLEVARALALLPEHNGRGWFTRWSGWGKRRTGGRSRTRAGRAACVASFPARWMTTRSARRTGARRCMPRRA